MILDNFRRKKDIVKREDSSSIPPKATSDTETIICRKCGVKLIKKSRFCRVCGYPVSGKPINRDDNKDDREFPPRPLYGCPNPKSTNDQDILDQVQIEVVDYEQ